MGKIFTFKNNILFWLIIVPLIFFLSNLGYLPIWFWNFWPAVLIFGNVLFWVTLITWIIKVLSK